MDFLIPAKKLVQAITGSSNPPDKSEDQKHAEATEKAITEQTAAFDARGVDREMRGITLPKKPVLQHMFVPPKFLEKIVSLATSPLVTDEEISTLKDLQLQYTRAEEFLAAHVRQSARKAFRAQQAEISKTVLEGNAASLSNRDVFTEEDFAQDWEMRRKSLKHECRRIRGSAAPIAEAVARRIGPLAASLAENFEKEERLKFSDWGLEGEFSPSRVLALLDYVAAHPERLAECALGTPPAYQLRFVGIKLS